MTKRKLKKGPIIGVYVGALALALVASCSKQSAISSPAAVHSSVVHGEK